MRSSAIPRPRNGGNEEFRVDWGGERPDVESFASLDDDSQRELEEIYQWDISCAVENRLELIGEW